MSDSARFTPRRILVVIEGDPAASPRALEALRMSVGLAAMEHPVRIMLREPGAGAGHGVARRYLDTLGEFGARVLPRWDPTAAAREADVVIRWGD